MIFQILFNFKLLNYSKLYTLNSQLKKDFSNPLRYARNDTGSPIFCLLSPGF